MKRLLSTLILILGFTVSAQEQDPCYSVSDFMSQTEGENPSIIKNFVGGWNMFGYPCSQSIDLSDAFSSIVEKVIIVKDNSGNVYMPEFSFNGIGFLEGGEGYQIKMNDTEYHFSFCDPINWPTIEGCTDCEAPNFNQWANLDDGSCDYDSDGDGVPDSEEVLGCQDSLACDYNINATDSGECTNYPQEGYDCDGNITAEIGDIMEGGYLFYIDETGTRGLVASLEDLTEGSNMGIWGTSEGFEWGCNGENVATGTSIGAGYGNTMDIVNQGCSTYNGGITAAQATLNYETEGYSDWYLPSKDELLEMYNTIGNGGAEGNIGGFETTDFTLYWSSSEKYWNLDYIYVWPVIFSSGSTGSGNYTKRESLRVRPIRAFGNWTMGCMDETACNYNSEANMADGSCTYAQQYYDCDGNINLEVGDEAFGGIVFYIDETGSNGLIAATEDIIGTFEWGCKGTVVGADQHIIGGGYNNTLDIFNQGCETYYGGPSAAHSALSYESQGYNDWYLPSRDELEQMYNSIGGGGQQGNIGNFTTDYYWSSSEWGSHDSWYVNFEDGTVDYIHPPINKKDLINVRAIRNFSIETENFGCINPSACNYNTDENLNDIGCEFPEEGFDCEGNVLNLNIGDLYQGGIIYFLDESGFHGLVAAIEDIEGTYVWGCYGSPFEGANGWGLGDGLDNTLEIVAGCSEAPIAASVALSYQGSGFTDWYLPSINELEEMSSISSNGSFDLSGNYLYWSSTEGGGNYSWSYMFLTNTTANNPNYSSQKVRPIRSF